VDGLTRLPGCVRGKATASILCGVLDLEERRRWPWTPALHAIVSRRRKTGRRGGGQRGGAVRGGARARGHAEAMIAWAGSPEALTLDNGQLESRAMRDGLEFMRPLTQAHLDLRAAREQPRHDVVDAGGDARTSCEDGHGRTRVMIYGPVRTTRIAYRRRGTHTPPEPGGAPGRTPWQGRSRQNRRIWLGRPPGPGSPR
jgi:hypothetical protein